VKLLRNKLLLVGLVCAAPFVLGTAAYLLGWSPGGAANYGELIPPRLLEGKPFAELRGKWVMVTFDAAACDKYCEEKLYYMRQVRRAQGKFMDRIERLWVVTDGAKPRAELLAALEDTRLASGSAQGFPGNAADHIYLVDPIGNLMMRFPRNPDPSRMIKDLQRLLKYSGAG
jgi:hypothetical protein